MSRTRRSRRFVTSSNVWPSRHSDYVKLLNGQPIWKGRTVGVGYLDLTGCMALGITGPILRSTGLPHDLRKSEPYCGYETYEFDGGASAEETGSEIPGCEQLCQRRLCERQIQRVRWREQRMRRGRFVARVLGHKLEPESRGRFTGEDGRTRCRADRRRRIGIGETHPFARQSVEVRRLVPRAPVAMQIAPGQIVSEDKDDVRSRGASRQRERDQH